MCEGERRVAYPHCRLCGAQQGSCDHDAQHQCAYAPCPACRSQARTLAAAINQAVARREYVGIVIATHVRRVTGAVITDGWRLDIKVANVERPISPDDHQYVRLICQLGDLRAITSGATASTAGQRSEE